MCGDLKSNTTASEAELQPSLLARLVNASPAVLYSCNAAGDCGTIAVTDNVGTVLGYAPEDFVSDPSFWAVRIHPEDSTRVFDEMPRLFRDGAQTIEYRLRHADGSYVWLRDYMKLECDDDGKPLRILGCWLDVTRQKPRAACAALILSSSRERTTTMTRRGDYAKQT